MKSTETSKVEEETVKKHKRRNPELQLATLTEIMNELKHRGYNFVWAGECQWGKPQEKDDVKVFLGSDDLAVGLRLSGEVIDCILAICKKCGANDPFTKTLQSILLQLEILFGPKPDNNQDHGAKL